MDNQYNIPDGNAGYTPGQEQVWGFSELTGIEAGMFFAPGSKRFYVDPNNVLATDFGNLGEDPSVPLATVAAAVTLCRDHMGDTIFIGANDTWTYSPVTYRPVQIQETVVVPVNKGGIRIVGASNNPLAVVWGPADNSEAALTIDAMDVLVEGICFYGAGVTNGTGIVAEWTPPNYGENLTVRRCYFFDLDYGIAMDYSWNNQIYANRFDQMVIAGVHNINVTGDPDYLTCRNNLFYDCDIAFNLAGADNVVIEDNVMTQCATGIVLTGSSLCVLQHNKIDTTVASGVVAVSGASMTESIIHGNIINGAAGGTNNFINLTGGSSNVVSDNWLPCTIAQYDTTCSDATSGAWINNHCTNGDTTAPPT